MPAWSEEIASILLDLASACGASLDQLQLQKLVYIAHGWQLALTGQPLTGDRPECAATGPVYRRLEATLAPLGLRPVAVEALPSPPYTILDHSEVDVLRAVWKAHAGLSAAQLSAVTRHKEAPWASEVANGVKNGRELTHGQIQKQFERFTSVADARDAD